MDGTKAFCILEVRVSVSLPSYNTDELPTCCDTGSSPLFEK